MTKENTARNARIKAERHAKRMFAQRNKTHTETIDGFAVLNVGIKVPRGHARNLRRKPLQVAYAKHMAALGAA